MDPRDSGGGIAAFMRTHIPAKRRFDIECKTLEHIVYEVTLDKVKWLIFVLYRPPSMPNNLFTKHMSTLLDKGIKYYENVIVIGDLNYDMLCTEKLQPPDDLCDDFDLTYIIKEPTSFKKDCNPSLVDGILTNKSKSCFKSLNFNTGVSDCHHLISTFAKGNIPICENIKQPYRSFKNLDVDAYINDLDKINLLNESCDNVTDI